MNKIPNLEHLEAAALNGYLIHVCKTLGGDPSSVCYHLDEPTHPVVLSWHMRFTVPGNPATQELHGLFSCEPPENESQSFLPEPTFR